jgi:zinc transport system substrate-binding protein
MMKIISVLIFLFSSFAGWSQNVVCSTAWTAALAKAAGVDTITILAPPDMLHPSEYELTVKDIVTIKTADLFIYAGYEQMMKQIKDAMKLDTSNSVRITTQYNPEVIQKEVIKIAKIADTEAIARKNLEEIDLQFALMKDWVVKNDLADIPVIVHFFQEPFAKAIGMKIVAVYGPAPLNASQINAARKTGAVLVIDNKHNPTLDVLQTVLPQASYLLFMNFPDGEGNGSLIDVLQSNFSILSEYNTEY